LTLEDEKMTTPTTPTQRRQWLDAAVLEILDDGPPRSTAEVRQQMDAGPALEDNDWARDYSMMQTRSRTQLVRRALRRLVRQGELIAADGPGDIADQVELFQAVRAREADNARTAIEAVQECLRAQGKLARVRKLLSAACAHDRAPGLDCLICQAFEEAGGIFQDREADREALADAALKVTT
jgi:lipopolysaccharide biosynthesis regulator YciM